MNPIGKLLIGFVLLIGLGVLVVLARGDGHGAIQVQVATAGHGLLSESVLASGNLVFENQVQLRSELTGRVARVLVDEGDEVVRGQLLMQLDREAFAADVERAAAATRAAEIEIQRLHAIAADLERQRQRHATLRERQLIGQDAYDQLASQHQIAEFNIAGARQALRQQRAQLEQAQDRLARTEFRAPIDGRLVSVAVTAGETVIAGTTNIVGSDLMELADPGTILAELRVDEADIARVQLGQPVEVHAAAHPGTAIRGRVVHIGSSARRQGVAEGLSFRVRVLLDADELELHAGMSCRAEILTDEGSATLNVPVAAVRRDDAGAHVWRVDADSRVHRIVVQPGTASDLAQAILSGLEPGDRVVVGPGRTLAHLRDGASVRIEEHMP